MEKNNTTKVITGECRMSYEHVWEPVSIDGNSPKKYSACILIRKDDTATLKKIKLGPGGRCPGRYQEQVEG